jgi:glycosyltransferase involved in cell wall biosynthesis
MSRIDVITGYYNRASVVNRTLDSLRNQSFQDFRLVVFDDASTDGTGAALMAYTEAAEDERIDARIHETNVGFVRGLATAIESVDSEYIAIQGSGDVSRPDRLERQAALLDARPEVGVVGCWYVNVVEREGVRRLRTPDASQASFATLQRQNFFSHGEVMIRRSAYESVGGYRTAFRNSQDLDLWLRLSLVSKFATVPEVLYERYVQFDGVSYDPRKLLRQAAYSIAARRISSMDDESARKWLIQIEAEGPECLVPRTDPEVQAKYVKAALRSAVWGATEDGVEIARAGINNRLLRATLASALRTYGSPAGAPIRPVVRRALGVRKR